MNTSDTPKGHGPNEDAKLEPVLIWTNLSLLTVLEVWTADVLSTLKYTEAENEDRFACCKLTVCVVEVEEIDPLPDRSNM